MRRTLLIALFFPLVAGCGSEESKPKSGVVFPQSCETQPTDCLDGAFDEAAGQCVYTPKPAGAVCRPATGPCDIEEACTGQAGEACPDDQHAPAASVCRPSGCVNGEAVSEHTCNELGQCLEGSEAPCAPYQCGANACLTACESLDDCHDGFFCIAGECVERSTYVDWWDGGAVGLSGLTLAIAPDGTRGVGTVQGRRLSVYSAGAGESAWNRETVATFASEPQLAVDVGGAWHLAWREQGFHRIKHAKREGSGWTISEVGTGHTPSLAVDSSGKPYVAFHTWVGNGSVNNLSVFDSGTWRTEPISSGGSMGCGCINDPLASCSCGKEPGRPYLAIGPEDDVHVLFPRYGTYQGIEYAKRGETEWAFEDIESAWFLEGATSVTIAPDGTSYLAYAVIGDVLRIANDRNGDWEREDTTLGAQGNTAMVWSEGLHLCGFDPSLYYATNATGTWVRTQVDDTIHKAKVCSIAVAADGSVHIAYEEGVTGSLKIADNRSGAFETSHVEDAKLYAGRMSLAVDGQGRDHMAAARRDFETPQTGFAYEAIYATDKDGSTTQEELGSKAGRMLVSVDAAGALDFLYYSDLSGSEGLTHATNRDGAWVRNVVVSTPDVGRDFGLAKGPNGLPRVAYHALDRVELAVYDGDEWSASEAAPLNGKDVSLATSASGSNHLLFSTDVLHHATDASGSFEVDVVNANSTSLMPNAIAVDSSGTLHAVFWSYGEGPWYARNDGSGWEKEPLSSVNGVSVDQGLSGFNEFSIVVDDEGVVHVIFANGEKELIGLARRDEGWVGTIYDRCWGEIEGVSAVKGPDGRIHIGYIAENGLHRAIVPSK